MTHAPAGRALAARHPLVVWGLVYTVLAFVLWWGVWTQGPAGHDICPCGDAARFLWFFEWPAYALGHGAGVLHSQRVFVPEGLNLLSDTSVLGPALVLTPVTVLFGPVVAMNVASLLAPVLAALSMLWLLRRWTRWTSSAAVGGFLFGFSPFIVTELGYGQLNMSLLFLLPLVVGVMDDILVRQAGRPVLRGLALGLLVVAQFWVSIEVLLMVALVAAVAVVVALARTVIRARAGADTVVRLRYPVTAFATAVGVAVVVLAYPVWYFLAGPAHLEGPIWANGNLARYGNSLTSFWNSASSPGFVAEMHRLGGYQGSGFPILGYLGIGTVVVALAGLVVWHRDRVILAFGGLGLLTAALSLGPSNSYWVPWDALQHLPWLGDVAEVRFSALTALSAAAVVALTVDRCRRSFGERRSSTAGHRRVRARRPVAGAVAGGAVAALAVVPVLVTFLPNVPLTVQAVTLPRWYGQTGREVPSSTVLLAYPAPFSGIQSSLAWQAADRLRFAMAGGGGPAGVASRAGPVRTGFQVLSAASLPLGAAPVPTASNTAAVRRALGRWRVDTVVVPDQPRLPAYDQGRGVAYAVAFFTALLGRAPKPEQRAWVWRGPPDAASAVPLTAGQLLGCTAGSTATAGPAAVAGCVLAAR